MLFIFSRFHKDRLLFVLDFTRIDVDDSKSYQDFIVHFYYFENGEEKALPLHFLPIDSGTPNDVDFFSSSLSDIFEEEIVKQHLKYASEIIFWSDGGRHHFKQRKSMLHVLEFQRKSVSTLSGTSFLRIMVMEFVMPMQLKLNEPFEKIKRKTLQSSQNLKKLLK